MLHSEEERAEYVLRVTGEHTLGTAGGFGSDEKSFGCGEDLIAFLRSLGLSEETTAKAQAALEQPAAGSQFIPFAYNMQISFARLQEADLDLFEA